MNILLVDDSIIMRTILQNTLSQHEDAHKFNFLTAENGLVAFEIIQSNEIHLMFLDWNMPIMAGDELVNTLREDKKFNTIRIIMATTEGGKDAVMKMAKKGINGYLVKPCDHASIMKSFNTVYQRMTTK